MEVLNREEVIEEDLPVASSIQVPPTAPKGLSLRENFSWTLLANIVHAASHWGILVTIARYGGPVEVGQFALALALSAPVILLLNLQLRSYQVTDSIGEYSDRQYIVLRIITSAFALIVLSTTAIIVYTGTMKLIIIGVSGIKVVESISDIFHGVLHRRERLDRVSQSKIIRCIGLFCIAFIFFVIGESLVQVTFVMAIWSMVMMVYDYTIIFQIVKTETRVNIEVEWLKMLASLAWKSAPLGLAMFFISINTNIPQYVLEAMKGEYELGVYSVMASFIVVGSTVIQSIGQSASPRLSRHVSKGELNKFNVLMLKMITGAAGVGLAGIALSYFIGDSVLEIIYGNEYSGYSNLLVYVMIAGLTAYVAATLRQAYIVLRLFYSQIVILLLSNILLLPLAYVLIEHHGATGAALALGGSLVFQIVLFVAVYVFRVSHATNRI